MCVACCLELEETEISCYFCSVLPVSEMWEGVQGKEISLEAHKIRM